MTVHAPPLAGAPPVVLCDTTLRDGDQAPCAAFGVADKVAIARALAAAGVTELEAGTPASGPHEERAVRAVVDLGLGVRVFAWGRALDRDLDAAVRSGVDAVALSLPVSDLHLERKLRRTREWVLDRAQRVVARAKALGLYVCLGAEDASRADPAFLAEYGRRARDCGADRLRFADTVGRLDPFETYERVRALGAATGLAVEVHAHDDLGLATANALAGVRAGAAWVSTTVLGLGERAGNAALEEVAVALKVTLGLDPGIRLAQLPALCEVVARAARREIPPWKAVVGRDAFCHASGIHVDGVLKHPETYEGFPPETVGRTRAVALGKHAGRASVRHCLGPLGTTLARDDAGALAAEVRATVARLGRPLSRADALGLWARRTPLEDAGEGPEGVC
ncbi:MAG: homocitrate synthase [Deferrisomatales bacterium]